MSKFPSRGIASVGSGSRVHDDIWIQDDLHLHWKGAEKDDVSMVNHSNA